MNKIDEAVLRIKHMEELYDRVLHTLIESPDIINDDDELQKAINELSDYLESGVWLSDYELDEQRLLPKALKRGVLSQDGLYELLCELKEGGFSN